MARSLLDPTLLWTACRASYAWMPEGTLRISPDHRARYAYTFVTLPAPVHGNALSVTATHDVTPWIGISHDESWLVYAAREPFAFDTLAFLPEHWRWFSARGGYTEQTPFRLLKLACNEFGLFCERETIIHAFTLHED